MVQQQKKSTKEKEETDIQKTPNIQPDVNPETETPEPKRKSQKVRILVSMYRYGDKIVSAHGIPNRNAWVKHHINKDKMKAEELFNISSALKTDPAYNRDNEYKTLISQVLDATLQTVMFPERRASTLKNIGNLIHNIADTEIEYFLTTK